MDQNEENNNPKKAAYRSQHFHFAGQPFRISRPELQR
jgi:hypothetical protein